MRVAVLDWGIGGSSCAQGLRARCPDLDIVYLSDSGHTPYGLLPRAALAKRVSRLLAMGQADLGVLACNAASSVLEEVHASHPVEGLVDYGLEVAMEVERGPIGVLAGQRVVTDGLYTRPLRAAGRTVLDSCGQPLSALVERGELSGRHVMEAVAGCISPLRGASAVLLACTHYAALSEHLRRAMPDVTLLDPVPRMVDVLVDRYGLSEAPGAGSLTVFTSGSPSEMRRAAASVYGWTLPPVLHGLEP